MKLTVVTALTALLGTTAAWADDQALQNRLALQRAQAEKNQRTTTIAVYGKRGVGERRANVGREEVRWERHDYGHGFHFFARPVR